MNDVGHQGAIGHDHAVDIVQDDVVVQHHHGHGEELEQRIVRLTQLGADDDDTVGRILHELADGRRRGFGFAVAHDEVKGKAAALAFNAVDDGGDEALILFQRDAMRTEFEHHQAKALYLFFL